MKICKVQGEKREGKYDVGVLLEFEKCPVSERIVLSVCSGGWWIELLLLSEVIINVSFWGKQFVQFMFWAFNQME